MTIGVYTSNANDEPVTKLSENTITILNSDQWYNITLPSYNLLKDTKYVIVWYASSGDLSNSYWLFRNNGGCQYTGGKALALDGSSWVWQNDGRCFNFEVYGGSAGNDVYHSRTCYDKGCDLGTCFNNSFINETLVQNCGSAGCSNGKCNLVGDTNGDCTVNILDLAAVGLAYGSKQGGQNWNPNADVNGDGQINIFDLAAVGLHYGDEC